MSQKLIKAAIEAAKASADEPGKSSPVPRVGAAILFPDGEIITAHRGEKCPEDQGEKYKGHHAEFVLIKKKLAGRNFAGCMLATTLEPCSKRGEKKEPCCEHIIASGIKKVFIGILDPNPNIYEHGCRKLKAAGVEVDFFNTAQRNEVSGITQEFIDQYSHSQAMEGTVLFDYEKKGGKFTFGSGDFEFITYWGTAGASSIYCLSKKGYSSNVLLTYSSDTEISEIQSSDHLDFSFATVSPHVNTIIIARNPKGHFLALKIMEVRLRQQPSVGVAHPLSAAVKIQYKITQHPSGDFRSKTAPYLLPSDYNDEWVDRTLQKVALTIGPRLERIKGLQDLMSSMVRMEDIDGGTREQWEILSPTIKYTASVRPIASEEECRTFKVTINKAYTQRETISREQNEVHESWVLDITIVYQRNLPTQLVVKRITDTTTSRHQASLDNLPQVDIQHYL